MNAKVKGRVDSVPVGAMSLCLEMGGEWARDVGVGYGRLKMM